MYGDMDIEFPEPDSEDLRSTWSDESVELSEEDLLKKNQCEEIRRELLEFQSVTRQQGESLYLLCNYWFSRWKSYVDYDNENQYKEALLLKKQKGVGDISPVQEAQMDFGKNPGPIDNSTLLNSDDELRSILVQGVDYVVLSETCWQLFYSWYGGGPEVKRTVISKTQKTRIDENHTSQRLSLDTDLVYLTFLFHHSSSSKILSSQESQQNTEPERCNFPETTTLGDLRDYCQGLIKKHLQKTPKNFRVWNFTHWPENVFQIHFNPDFEKKTFAEISLRQNQIILIELPIGREGEEVWPLDSETLKLGRESSVLEEEEEELEESQNKSTGRRSIQCPEAGLSSGPVQNSPSKKHTILKVEWVEGAIQLLSHTTPLSQFLISGEFRKSLNTTNPDGTHGVILSLLSKVINQLWEVPHSNITYKNNNNNNCYSGQMSNNKKLSIVSCHDLFSLLPKYPFFRLSLTSGSVSLFLWSLLLSLHEDSNHIIHKPSLQTLPLHSSFSFSYHKKTMSREKSSKSKSVSPTTSSTSTNYRSNKDKRISKNILFIEKSREHWSLYTKRHLGFFVNTFHGQLNNTCICSHCHYHQSFFEIFQGILDLPRLDLTNYIIHFVAKDSKKTSNRNLSFSFFLPKVTTFSSLSKKISKKVELSSESFLIFAEVNSSRITRIFFSSQQLNLLVSNKSLYAFEVDKKTIDNFVFLHATPLHHHHHHNRHNKNHHNHKGEHQKEEDSNINFISELKFIGQPQILALDRNHNYTSLISHITSLLTNFIGIPSSSPSSSSSASHSTIPPFSLMFIKKKSPHRQQTSSASSPIPVSPSLFPSPLSLLMYGPELYHLDQQSRHPIEDIITPPSSSSSVNTLSPSSFFVDQFQIVVLWNKTPIFYSETNSQDTDHRYSNNNNNKSINNRAISLTKSLSLFLGQTNILSRKQSCSNCSKIVSLSQQIHLYHLPSVLILKLNYTWNEPVQPLNPTSHSSSHSESGLEPFIEISVPMYLDLTNYCKLPDQSPLYSLYALCPDDTGNSGVFCKERTLSEVLTKDDNYKRWSYYPPSSSFRNPFPESSHPTPSSSTTPSSSSPPVVTVKSNIKQIQTMRRKKKIRLNQNLCLRMKKKEFLIYHSLPSEPFPSDSSSRSSTPDSIFSVDGTVLALFQRVDLPPPPDFLHHYTEYVNKEKLKKTKKSRKEKGKTKT